jgi:hypothetical protein
MGFLCLTWSRMQRLKLNYNSGSIQKFRAFTALAPQHWQFLRYLGIDLNCFYEKAYRY